ncbi:hypothetical protein [Mycolicibacterium tusciae]|uniref:hypothetical protein n=1 Tax=Mycolicibacterium tusciae TaxID=75922 RepID=UPI00024A502C|nr:hypothetical protein [Mycolicibacterium tusciae]
MFRRLTGDLTLTPEGYIQRNVRVSGFLWEPIDAQFAEKLARFGPEVIEKFFVTNAELLMP